ncbi:MAG: class I SAM-dependent methyltransferase, partial [Planctomycetota bacterium]
MAFHGDFDPRSAPEEIRSSSLWIVEKRGDGGGLSEYHGNFILEIPHQLMRRYTKPGDVVLDCFAGSGTTLEVGKRLKRQVIASDIYPQHDGIVKADAEKLELNGVVDLVILHPPYWDIVQYTYFEQDLSNCCDLE